MSKEFLEGMIKWMEIGGEFRKLNRRKPVFKPNIMSKEFTWDDKSIEEMLVKAFSERLFVGSYKTPKTIIEEFKASHSTEDKREWEIVSLKYLADEHVYPFSVIPNGKFVIHSVRRLSDNSVWSVGDVLDRWGEITSFKIQSNKFMLALCNNEGNTSHVFIEDFSKLPQRTKLFDCEDGSVIYEGDTFYLVQKRTFNVLTSCRHKPTDPDQWYFFTTYDKAKEFVLMNKPLLSVNDLLEYFEKDVLTKNYCDSIMLRELKELAKSRL